MADIRTKWMLALVAVFLLGLINFEFLGNPLFFDDQYFFLKGYQKYFLDADFALYPRSWVYKSIAINYAVFDGDIRWLRLVNLIAHAGVGVVLFFFAKRLLHDLDRRVVSKIDTDSLALLVAILFVFHPLATLTHGYLIQRTVVLSTLFSIFSMYAFWLGLRGGRWWLLLSCLSYLLSVFAKEHSILTPVGAFLLLALHWRSGLALGIKLKWVILGLLCQAVVAISVLLQVKGFIGAPYEPLTEEVMAGSPDIAIGDLFWLSVLNQACLFFKYLFLWVLPIPSWLSVDVRDPFPLGFESWKLWAGGICFLGYAALASALLWRGRALGVLGFSMLVPLVLFLTEFSVVRFQEPFVLYRSYLWAVGGFIALALVLRRLSAFVCVAAVTGFLLFFMAMTYDRLTTYSHSFLIWDEAASLYEREADKSGVFGGYRIYFNRGNAMLREGMLVGALESYNKAIALNPEFYQAVHQRGVVSLELKEWERARSDFQFVIERDAKYVKSYLGLAQALKEQGHAVEAANSLRVACLLGQKSVCE